MCLRTMVSKSLDPSTSLATGRAESDACGRGDGRAHHWPAHERAWSAVGARPPHPGERALLLRPPRLGLLLRRWLLLRRARARTGLLLPLLARSARLAQHAFAYRRDHAMIRPNADAQHSGTRPRRRIPWGARDRFALARRQRSQDARSIRPSTRRRSHRSPGAGRAFLVRRSCHRRVASGFSSPCR